MVMFAMEIGLFLCRGHFAAIGDAIGLSIIAISTALFTAGVTWMLYMAVEPWVRRHWPKTIISWSRLLSRERLARSGGGPRYFVRRGSGDRLASGF